MLQDIISASPTRVHPFIFVVFAFWSLFWKGMALWKSARRGQKYWFIVLLVVNTVGILEIIYLYYYWKKEQKSEAKETKAVTAHALPSRKNKKSSS